MIDTVELSGLVLMKIIKHGLANPSQDVTGNLAGMDFDNVLEVTNCFPMLSDTDRDSDAAADSSQYDRNMFVALDTMNFDSTQVGWYLCSSRGTFLSERMLEGQFVLQETFGDKCVCLVVDPLKAMQGVLSVKAVRLTAEFIRMYKNPKDSFAKGSLLSSSNVYEEVPVVIKNLALARALVAELASGTSAADRRAPSSQLYMEKNLESLLEGADQLLQEQNRYQYYLRKSIDVEARRSQRLMQLRVENDLRRDAGQEPLPEEDDLGMSFGRALQHPNRLESVITLTQLASCSDRVGQSARTGFSQLYVLEGLHRESAAQAQQQ